MNTDISKLLEAADDHNAEHPHAFDRENLLERLATLKSRLEEIVGRHFDLDDKVQDASFCADLSVQHSGAKPNWLETVFVLRFSNFGELFTFWSNCEVEQLPRSTQQALIVASENAGFHFVPPEALEEPYIGRCTGVHGVSWGIRYFDYL